MELPNRKQRRAWAKEMGLLKQKSKLPFDKQMEISRRAMEAGKQIHVRNIERNLEREAKLKNDIEIDKNQEEINNLINEGKTLEEAMSIISLKNTNNDGTLDS